MCFNVETQRRGEAKDWVWVADCLPERVSREAPHLPIPSASPRLRGEYFFRPFHPAPKRATRHEQGRLPKKPPCSFAR
jgi:hypothetical protein